jgi:hypothetical protein
VFDLDIVTVPPSSSDVLSTVFGGTLTPNSQNLGYDYEAPSNASELVADFVLFKASDGNIQSSMALGTLVFTDGRWQDRFVVANAFDDAVSMDEDNSQEISFVGFDPVDQSIDGITITDQPSNGTLGTLSFSGDGMLATWTATYTPDSEFSGTDEIKFTVSNSVGDSDRGTISITVNAVNDLPTLASINDVSFNEDGSTSVSLSYSDVDSDVSVSVSSASDALGLSLDGSLLTIESDAELTLTLTSLSTSEYDNETEVEPSSLNDTSLIEAKVGKSLTAFTVIEIVPLSESPTLLLTVNLISSVPENSESGVYVAVQVASIPSPEKERVPKVPFEG